jgi:uridylate kinase
MLKYKRILLKISGELLGSDGSGFSRDFLDFITDEIYYLKKNYPIDIALVVGGGNIIRGNDAQKYGIDKTTADYMGMIATVLNALALQSILESKGLETRVMTSIEIKSVAEPYIRRKAIRHLEKGRIVIFAGGTGSPFFSTDTAGALRAIEIKADVLLKGTKVDGVYTKDPFKFSDAQKYDLLDYSSIDGIEKIEIAGSFRRFKETIGDVDILILSKRDVSDDILKHPRIKEILAKGETKISFLYELSNNKLIQIDIRVIDEKSWGSALMYFTGSKEHNIQMRDLAIEKGYKLNEYGLFKDEMYIAGKSEEEVFDKLLIQYIPPEIREARGEIELAKQFKIPKLIDFNDIKGDLQVHSRYSDGVMDFWEIEAEALKMNYEYVAITDHSKSLKVAGGMDIEDLLKRNEEIKKFNRNSKVKLLISAEVEILNDGSLDYPDEILKNLDLVLASIHNVKKDEDITQRYLKAMDNPYVDIIAHPTGRLVLSREPYKLNLDELFKKASERKIILEINAHYNRLDLNDLNILKAKQYGVKFSIGTDAHNRNGFYMMIFGVKMARKGLLTKEDVINSLSLIELLEYIKFCREYRIKQFASSNK